MPSHQTEDGVKDRAKSDGTPITHCDWRANRLADANAKLAVAPYLLDSGQYTQLHQNTSLTKAVLARIGFTTFASNHHVVEEQLGDIVRSVVRRDSAPPPRPVPSRKLPATSNLSSAEVAAFSSEFGVVPRDQSSDDEANVSPFEDDGNVIPAKRFRGLAGSSRSDRARRECTKRNREIGPSNMRSCQPRTKRPKRQLRELRSDASVELELPTRRVDPDLRARIAAHWLSSSCRRVNDDIAMSHWRSGQGGGLTESSDTDDLQSNTELRATSPA